MTTVREAVVTKSGNPLCGKPHVELTLRGVALATDNADECTETGFKEVAK
ncbi:MAG: hypothetical protein V1879_04135 [Pseudomonadota bacterium]